MRIALCNEVIVPMPFPKQCEYAAKLGYDGLEIAPYTLSEDPSHMSPALVVAPRRRGRGHRGHRPALAAGQARGSLDQHERRRGEAENARPDVCARRPVR